MNPFTEHPASVGETYLQHLRAATVVGARMVRGGLACLVHAVFPFICVRTGSNCINELHGELTRRRTGVRQGSSPSSP
jgi:hypothetical protein